MRAIFEVLIQKHALRSDKFMMWRSILYNCRLFSSVKLPEIPGEWTDEVPGSADWLLFSDAIASGGFPGPSFRWLPEGWGLRMDGNRVYLWGELSLFSFAGRNRLYSVVLPWLIRSRGGMVLRGGAVRIGSAACVVLGRAGSGKTETLMGLCERGAELISDDAVVLSDAAPDLFVTQGAPYLKLTCGSERLLPGMTKIGPVFDGSMRTGWAMPSPCCFGITPIRNMTIVVNSFVDCGFMRLSGLEIIQNLDALSWASLGDPGVMSLSDVFLAYSKIMTQAHVWILRRPLSESRDHWVDGICARLGTQ